MRKAISIILTAILVSSAVAPAAAQKGRTPGPKKLVKAIESTRFASISAYTDGRGTYITWQMEAEIGNIGFYVYRVSKTGVELLSPAKLVAGAAMRASEVPAYGETYGFFDDETGDAAYYVEALSLKGVRITTDRVYPQYVSDLSTVSGMSSTELANRAETEPGRLESSILTLTKEIANEMAENQLVPDPVTHRTVISQPGVARIGVRNEGLFRVSRAQLQAAGFNVNSDSSLWQLYVEGVEQAIIIGNNADYIEFYGKGTDTVETDIRQYYLMTGATPGRRMETRVAQGNTSTVVTPSYLQTFVKKERSNFIEDILNGPGLENYFGRGVGSGVVPPMTFNLSGVDFANVTSRLNLKFQGYSELNHSVEVTLNDQVLATPATGDEGHVVFTKEYSIPTSFLREGANTINFRTIGPAGDFVFFDTMSIDFSRKFLADQNKVAFYTQNYRIAKLDGFTSPNVRVFDMTHDGSPALITNLTFQQNGSTFGVNMPAERGRSFYAVEDSAILAPFSVTPNNPELLSVPTNAADLVIIAHKDYMEQAEAWATYRRGPGQNFTVKVFEVSEVYDEFSYGSLSSAAMKSFLQYTVDEWLDAPEYVLLMGDASFDSRNYENQGFWNMIPPRMVGATYSEVASDESLADFNNDGLAEISIGRIASRTSAGITTVFNKVVHWETMLPTPLMDRGAVFAFDHNDAFYNFEIMSQNIRNQLPMTTPATMVYRGMPNANSILVNEMNLGKYMINYAGHGTSGTWGGNPVFFNILTVNTLQQNVNNPAVYTMLTCSNGAFHYLFNDSFAEVLTKSVNRGAVAAWASTGKTTADVQERMAIRFYAKVAEGNIPRLGDLIKDAKSVLINDGTDVRLSWALVGDPMLKVR